MTSRVVSVENDGRRVTASITGRGPDVVALSPGAGGTRTTPQLLKAAARLDPARFTTVLFHFPYQEAKRKFPDPPALLESTVARVAEFCRAEFRPRRLFLGGRSMGGRICSQAVAKGLGCDGLAFLAYPLHPPGKPEQLRDAHLGSIGCPMLFLQGTRDVFARRDLLESVLSKLGAKATLRLFEDADHSFKTQRGAALNSPKTEAAVLDALSDWLEARV